MKSHFRFSARFIAWMLLVSVSAAFAQDRSARPYTLSGISSGGFMAAQMGVIYSDRVKGVGTVAGGVYYCAKDHFPIKFNKEHSLGLFLAELNGAAAFRTPNAFLVTGIGDYLKQLLRIAPENPTYQAVGVCMADPRLAHASSPDAPMDLDFIQKFFSQGLIADPAQIRSQRVFIYHGAKDDVVGVAMQDKMKEFYTRLGVSPESLALERGMGGHNFPTTRQDGIDCAQEGVPYLANCNNDIAGKILKHLTARPLSHRSMDLANLYRVNQRTKLMTDSLSPYGYLYAPPECLSNPESCSVHVALHGCKMSDFYDEAFQKKYEQQIQTREMLYVVDDDPDYLVDPPLSLSTRVPRMGALRFALDSGYAEYASDNHLMILFPQTRIMAKNFPLNPKGCWDWYGWTQTDDTHIQGEEAGKLYATNRGSEPRWLDDFVTQAQGDPKALIMEWPSKTQDLVKARAIGSANPF